MVRQQSAGRQRPMAMGLRCRRTADPFYGRRPNGADGALSRRRRVAIVARTQRRRTGRRCRCGRLRHRPPGFVEATVEAASSDAILNGLVGRRVLVLMVVVMDATDGGGANRWQSLVRRAARQPRQRRRRGGLAGEAVLSVRAERPVVEVQFRLVGGRAERGRGAAAVVVVRTLRVGRVRREAVEGVRCVQLVVVDFGAKRMGLLGR